MKKLNFGKKVSKFFELPGELVSDITKLSITDFSELEIINLKSLVEYEKDMIRVNTKDKLIRIEGDNLTIGNITDEEILIKGNIKGVIFE